MAARIRRSASTTVRRQRQLARYDDSTVFAIIDAAPCCHVAVLRDGLPMALPTIATRVDATVYLHGAPASALLRDAGGAERVSATFTCIDGVVVARSGFHSTLAYRSAVVVGATRLVTGEELVASLDALVDHILPGRSAEVRRPTRRELAATSVVALEIEEASAKVSLGPPQDPASDLEGEAWAGIVPATLRYGTPQPATDGRVGRGLVAVPASVGRLRRRRSSPWPA